MSNDDNQNIDNDDLMEILPSAIAISWGLVKEPQRGPKREMSIQKIVDASVEIADRDGLSAVSMGRVASSLGFTAMSLYRYIPSKDDLLILMQEAVSNIPLPARDSELGWREEMRKFVELNTNLYVEHPWFADIPIYGAPITPNNLRVVDWLLGGMKDLPLNEFEKMSIVLLLSSYARSSGILKRDFIQAMKKGISSDAFIGKDYNDALKQLVTKERFPELYPLIQSGSYTGSIVEGEVSEFEEMDFDFGMERILDGIESFLAPRMKGLGRE